MSKKEVSDHVIKIMSAARDFCESCENIGDTKNEDYEMLRKALECGEKASKIALNLRKKAEKLSKEQINKLPPCVESYINMYAETFRNIIIIELWYAKINSGI